MGCFTCGDEPHKVNTPIRPYYNCKPPFTVNNLYHVLEESAKITSFTVGTAFFSNCTISDSTVIDKYKTFPSCFGIAQFNSTLYICGGLLSDSNEFSDKNVQIVVSAQSFGRSERASMLQGKCSMGMRSLSPSTFLVVGGYNSLVLSAVEQYDLNADKWASKGSLNVARYSPGVCTFGGRYIYVAGGCTADSKAEQMVRVVERCDMIKINVEWIVIPLYQSDWESAMDFGFFQASESDVLICGGYKDCVTNEVSKDVYLYDVVKGVIKRVGELNRKDVFISGFYYANENELYGFGITGSVYCYNKRTNQWTDFVREGEIKEEGILINVGN